VKKFPGSLSGLAARVLVFRYVTKLPPGMAKVVFEGSGDLPRCLRKCWHGDRRVAAPGPSE
jgi:hypothetical protein